MPISQGRDRKSLLHVYGSFAEETPFHDIDMGVYVVGIKAEDSTMYALEMAQAISGEERIPVDIRVLNHAPLLFLYHVIKGRLVFERDEEARKWLLYAMDDIRSAKSLCKDGIFSHVCFHSQHYDYITSKVFFDELGIPGPDYNLEVGSSRLGDVKRNYSDISKAKKVLGFNPSMIWQQV